MIPPAWSDVWICSDPNCHLQAIGVDDAGRRQYVYHPDYRHRRDEDKHRRVVMLARRLPSFRDAVADDLHDRGLTKQRVVAAALRMLDHGVFRTGGEEYAAEHGSKGVATLRRDDVRRRDGSRIRPAGPTRGCPSLFSWSPGRSPTRTTRALPRPSPNTARVASRYRSQPRRS